MCPEHTWAMLYMLDGLLTWTAHLEHHLRSGRVPPGPALDRGIMLLPSGA
jgi:hypothetical protein